MMQIICGCEQSQIVATAFRAKGHEAFSCDTEPCTGNHPDYHLQMDVLDAIKGGRITTQAGTVVSIKRWDMGIFFPPCTYVAASGNKWLKDQPKPASGSLVGAERRLAQQEAVNFAVRLYDSPIKRVGLENPVGRLSTLWKPPTQIVQPWWFGDSYTKTTCLWLKNLPKLNATNIVDPGKRHITKSGKSLPDWYNLPPGPERARIRSLTFAGLGQAMAEQWSHFKS